MSDQTAIPQPVVEALVRLRERGNLKMVDRKAVMLAVKSARVWEWLENNPERYADALNAMILEINGANEPGAYDFDYSADCAACLRARPHTRRQHEAILQRNRNASKGDKR